MSDLLSPDQQATVDSAFNDLMTDTFGTQPVKFIDKSDPISEHGGSPSYTEAETELTAHVVAPKTTETVNDERAQWDFDLQLQFATAYLVAQSLTKLTEPAQQKREWQWEYASQRYSTRRITNSGQVGDSMLLVLIDLERI